MNSNPEYNAFKHRIRELQDTITNSKRRVQQRLDHLNERHHDLTEKERMSAEGAMLTLRMMELKWVLEGL